MRGLNKKILIDHFYKLVGNHSAFSIFAISSSIGIINGTLDYSMFKVFLILCVPTVMMVLWTKKRSIFLITYVSILYVYVNLSVFLLLAISAVVIKALDNRLQFKKTYLLFLACIFQLGDAFTTVAGLKKGYTENNPLVNLATAIAGLNSFIMIKVGLIAVLISAALYMRDREAELILKSALFAGVYLTVQNGVILLN